MSIEQLRAELLPCPFCGCAMSLSAVARDWWRITGGHNEDCILYDHRHDAPQTDYQKQALIEDWNRRAALQSQPTPPEISRDLLGKIVDEVFDGAIEDASVIEDIYRVIARETALQSQDREDATAAAMNAVADRYAHVMALHLECILLNYSGPFSDDAMQTLGQYRDAMNAIHELESPTHMGEPDIDHARRIEGEKS